jgi:hypothetical protein
MLKKPAKSKARIAQKAPDREHIPLYQHQSGLATGGHVEKSAVKSGGVLHRLLSESSVSGVP